MTAKFLLFKGLILCAVLHLAGCSTAGRREAPGEADASVQKRVVPYLIFSGECREALAFYADCLEGEVVNLTTFSESGVDVEDKYGGRIFNSELRADGIRIMASDNLPGDELKQGNNFALFLIVPSEPGLERLFARLSSGGSVIFPLEGEFGMVEDRYGVRWMLEGVE
jgi:PhnB protein